MKMDAFIITSSRIENFQANLTENLILKIGVRPSAIKTNRETVAESGVNHFNSLKLWG